MKKSNKIFKPKSIISLSKLRQMRFSPEALPLMGLVSFGVILGASHFAHLLTSHNDIYVNLSVPLRERFSKDVPQVVTKSHMVEIKHKVPLYYEPHLQNPFEEVYPNNVRLEDDTTPMVDYTQAVENS